MQAGQVLFFPITIPTLRFRYACLAALKIWEGDEKMALNLEMVMERAFKAMEGSVKSIALTEFNE